MDIDNLRCNFKKYMQNRFPNDGNVTSTVSMAFFARRHGDLLDVDFYEILSNLTIPDDYRDKLEDHFINVGRKDPRGNAGVYERSLRLLLEYINEINGAPKALENHMINKSEQKTKFKTYNNENPPPILNLHFDKNEAGKLLVKIGKERFDNKGDHPWVHLTGNHDYDATLNDLENNPHAFILACLMDKQIKAERAWEIPCIIMAKVGTDIESLAAVSEDEYVVLFNQLSLHRFNNEMAKVFNEGVQRIKHYYNGDASLIWKNKPSSAKIVYELLQFRGAGIKIATMTANILARQFQIEFSDYYSIDVSPDVHIKRVLWRMGLIEDESNTDSVIYKARELNPEFPGVIDFSAWEIGRMYCKPRNPICYQCSVNSVCLKRLTKNNAT